MRNEPTDRCWRTRKRGSATKNEPNRTHYRSRRTHTAHERTHLCCAKADILPTGYALRASDVRLGARTAEPMPQIGTKSTVLPLRSGIPLLAPLLLRTRDRGIFSPSLIERLRTRSWVGPVSVSHTCKPIQVLGKLAVGEFGKKLRAGGGVVSSNRLNSVTLWHHGVRLPALVRCSASCGYSLSRLTRYRHWSLTHLKGICAAKGPDRTAKAAGFAHQKARVAQCCDFGFQYNAHAACRGWRPGGNCARVTLAGIGGFCSFFLSKTGTLGC